MTFPPLYIILHFSAWLKQISLAIIYYYTLFNWNSVTEYLIVWIFINIALWPIVIVGRVFVNGQGDQGSIPGWVIPKTQIIVLDASLLNTQHHKVSIKGKRSNLGKEVVSSPTPQCSSYCKGRLQVALDYGQPTYITIFFCERVSMESLVVNNT